MSTVLTQPGVNFTNIFKAHLRQYSFANKKFNLYCQHKKASRKTFVRKMLVKLTPCGNIKPRKM